MAKLLIILLMVGALANEVAPDGEPPLLIDSSQPAPALDAND